MTQPDSQAEYATVETLVCAHCGADVDPADLVWVRDDEVVDSPPADPYHEACQP